MAPDAEPRPDQQRERDPVRKEEREAHERRQHGDEDRVPRPAIQAARHEPRAGALVDADAPRGAQVQLRREHQRRRPEDQHASRHAQHGGQGGREPHEVRKPARRNRGHRGLGEQRDGEHEEERFAEVLTEPAGTEEHDAGGAVAAELHPGAPAEPEPVEDEHRDERERAGDHAPERYTRSVAAQPVAATISAPSAG